jgi:PDZ domain
LFAPMSRPVNRFIVFAGLIVVVTWTTLARAEDNSESNPPKRATAEGIATWIKDLDDARYLVREEATQRLTEAGASALDSLLVVANSDRPEPADRAIWILRRFSHSRDSELALAALDRLIQLQNRPAIVAKAEAEYNERSLAACEQRLGPLGADIGLQPGAIGPQGVVPMLIVRLGERWHGTSEDLRQLSQLRQQRYFSLEGAAIGDDVVKMFAEKEKLAALHLIDTKVTPAAVDAVKEKHPDATVFVRNLALLGVTAESRAAGVIVTSVQSGSAAATAGIQQDDVIATIDGHKLPDFDRLTVHVAQHQPGDKVEMEIIRNDQRLKLTAALGIRPEHE